MYTSIRKMRVVITTIAIFVCIGSLKAQTETVNLLAISDNTIFESNPLFNSNGSGALMYVGNDLSGYATRALMKFDVAGSLPAGVTVVSARLRLTMDWSYNLYSTGQETLELHRLLNDWGEGDSNNGLQSNQPGGEEGAIAQSGDATWLIRMYSNPFNSPGPPFWTNPGGDFATAVSTGASVIPWPDLYNWDSTPQLVADVQDNLKFRFCVWEGEKGCRLHPFHVSLVGFDSAYWIGHIGLVGVD